jgi:hypothetical protein
MTNIPEMKPSAAERAFELVLPVAHQQTVVVAARWLQDEITKIATTAFWDGALAERARLIAMLRDETSVEMATRAFVLNWADPDTLVEASSASPQPKMWEIYAWRIRNVLRTLAAALADEKGAAEPEPEAPYSSLDPS